MANPKLFLNIDFLSLRSEADVREEVCVKLLNDLGYRSEGPYTISREVSLLHPYSMIGSKKIKINIFPDYILKGVKSTWILDAKKSTESVLDPESISQVFSYAIHQDVGASLFGLCNGLEISLFSVRELKQPLLHFKISEYESNWQKIHFLLDPGSVPSLSGYKPYPDFGFYLLGIHPDRPLFQFPVRVREMGILDNGNITFSFSPCIKEVSYCASFEILNQTLIDQFRNCLKPEDLDLFDRLSMENPHTFFTSIYYFVVSSFLGMPVNTESGEPMLPLVVCELKEIEEKDFRGKQIINPKNA